MYPGLVLLKVDLHAVNVVDILVGVDLLELIKDLVNEGIVTELDLILCDEVLRVGLLKLAHLHLLMGKITQEQGNTNHGVTAGVDGGIDDASVAFSADKGANLVHEGGDIHFTHGRCIVLAAVLFSDVTQCTGT